MFSFRANFREVRGEGGEANESGKRVTESEISHARILKQNGGEYVRLETETQTRRYKILTQFSYFYRVRHGY